MNYKSTLEKFEFSTEIKPVYNDLLARLQPHGAREYTSTGPDNACGKNPIVDVFYNNPDLPYEECMALGIVKTWKDSPVIIYPEEIIVGVTRPFYPVMEHFSWGLQYNRWILDQPCFDGIRDAEYKRIDEISSRLFPLGGDHIEKEGARLYGKEAYNAVQADNLQWSGGYQGHTIVRYEELLSLGLDGLLEKIQKYSVKAKNERAKRLYRCSEIIIRGMSDWILMYAAAAAHAAEGAKGGQREKYLEIEKNCRSVAHDKPKTLYEAAQLMWFYCLWDWCDCVGRADLYLEQFRRGYTGKPYSEDDVLSSLMLKMFENGIHNITVGGQTENGEDATSKTTFMLLQMLRTIHNTHPRMSVRFHKNSPKELWELACVMWAEGMSDPSIVSDETVISGLCKRGVSLEEARGYSMLGCQEIEIPGKSNFGCEDGSINLAKVLEYTINGGKSPTSGVQVGPSTPPLDCCNTFEEFYDAFCAQIEYFTKNHIALCNKGVEIRIANFSKMVKTPLTIGCLEKGLWHDEGGPIYNFGVIETAGFAATADSLYAVKKLVFDDKTISAKELKAALANDFSDNEALRRRLLAAPKFGCDDDGADEMACRVLNTYWDEIAKYKSLRGDTFLGACSLLSGGISYGAKTGALPDGRHAGEPLGNSIGPRPGADTNGTSAMLSSVAKLPLEKGVGGTTLNVVLTTNLLADEVRRSSIIALLKTYLLCGGQMAQITTANKEELIAARECPERYGNLIVRIGGYSVQFVLLSENEQEEIISRY